MTMPMPIPDGSAITTPRDMLQELKDLHGEFRELRGALTPTLAELRHNVDADRKDIESLFTRANSTDRRVTKLQAYLAAAWAVLVLLVTIAGVVAGFLGLRG